MCTGVLMRTRLVLCVAAMIMLGLCGCTRPFDPRHVQFPKGSENYRLLGEADLCGELPLFERPDPQTMVGTVLEGARYYTKPETGEQFRAVSVLTIVKGRRVDRWFRRADLVGRIYVLKNDPRLKNCHYWLEEEKPVRPLPTEIPAD
jgi:hypothetical protein